jgi:hypothetical protein
MLKLARARIVRYAVNSSSASTSGPSRTEARFEKNWSTASKNDWNDSPIVADCTAGKVRAANRAGPLCV